MLCWSRDASFQTDRDDYKSQAGYVFCLNGGAFSWKSSKQDTTADSTTKAEYMAAAEAAKEGVWIKKFISELGVVPSINDPIPLFCDNTGAIAQAKEPRSHQKTKHIVRRYHIIREIVDRGDVEICKVGTDDNIADPLTKPLGKLKHEGHTRSMGIRPMPDWPQCKWEIVGVGALMANCCCNILDIFYHVKADALSLQTSHANVNS